MQKKITPRERIFINEYLVDLNPRRAALAAGYSENVAVVKSFGWVSEGSRKPHILEEVKKALDARAKRTEITADRVLEELGRIGFANLSDVTKWGTREVAFGFTSDGKRLPAEDIGEAAVVRYEQAPFVDPMNSDDLPPEIMAAVSEVGLTKDGFKIKMHDKVSALEKIARHLGMFNKDTLAMTGKDGAPLFAPMVFVKMKPDPIESDG